MSQTFESLYHLQRVLLGLRWGAFILSFVALPYLKQILAFSDTLQGQLLILILAYGGISALDEYLLRKWLSRTRWALYGILVGDLAAVTWLLYIIPGPIPQGPVMYLLPIVGAAFGLGMAGGLMGALLASVAIIGRSLISAVPPQLLDASIWALLLVIAGLATGYVAGRWEASFRPVEEAHRWISRLNTVTTMTEVADTILDYLDWATDPQHARLHRQGNEVSHPLASALLLHDRKEHQYSPIAYRHLTLEGAQSLKIWSEGPWINWLLARKSPTAFRTGGGYAPIQLPAIEGLGHHPWCLLIPIYRGEELVAIALAFSSQKPSYEGAQFKAMSIFSVQAGAAIKKANAYAEIERQAQRVTSLIETGNLAVAGGIDSVFQWMADGLHQLFDADLALVALADAEGSLTVKAASGRDGEKVVGGDLSQWAWPIGLVLKTSTPHLERDLQPHFAHSPFNTTPIRSFMAVPLYVRGKISGLAMVANGEPTDFQERDLMLFLILMRQGALLIEETMLLAEAGELREKAEEAKGHQALAESQALSFAQDLRRLIKEASGKTKEVEIVEMQALAFAREFHLLYRQLREQREQRPSSPEETEEPSGLDATDFSP